MKFKKLTGPPKFELAPYVKEYLQKHKYHDVKMYMGCDSQTKASRGSPANREITNRP